MTGQEWIIQFAERLGVPAPDPQTFEALLALAGTAAHSSERIAAPIACYLVGVAACDGGLDIAQAQAIAESIAGSIGTDLAGE